VSYPRDPASDRFILSKGHAAPVLYAAWAEAGLIDKKELVKLRQHGHELEGHPTPKQSFVDVATGSLGHGLSIGAGMAYTGKYFDKASYRTYVMIGDGESAEGSVWEAINFASLYKLDNLVAIFDINRLGQSEPAPLQHNMEVYRKRLESFGWHAIVVDGHDIEALCRALHEAKTTSGRPTALVAKTYKGQGVSAVSNKENWHGKPLGAHTQEGLTEINNQIVNKGDHGISPQPVIDDVPKHGTDPVKLASPPDYPVGSKYATRKAYGNALKKLGDSDKRIIALDGDTKNSTFSLTFKNAHPDRYIECFIAEQNLVGVAIGCGCRDRTIPFASTFSAFFSRAYDQIRMGAISQTNVNLVGSHVGCSIGEDGPSQMALEDIAMMRAIPTCTVFYPSDAVSCERAIELAANTKGICFIRTSRPDTIVNYSADEVFTIGKGKLVRSSDKDSVTVVGAGVTLQEATSAADQLAKENVFIRVVDPFTIKPIDAELLNACATATGGKVITVEDHYPEGGVGDAVSDALGHRRDVTVKRLAVRKIPGSGPGHVLMDEHGIAARSIIEAVKSMIA
jgi:transketolase